MLGFWERFFCDCFGDIQRASLKPDFDVVEPSKRLFMTKMEEIPGLLLLLSIYVVISTK